MANPDSEFYYRFYHNQRGGDFPVFRGARYIQYGNGFGDILRNIFRSVFPVVVKGATTFLGDMVRAKEEGQDWKGAAKSAILPTAKTIFSEASQHLTKSEPPSTSEIMNQEGSGRCSRRKRKHTNVYKKQKNANGPKSYILQKKHKHQNYNF